jgi:hypothetical protein
MKKKSDNLLDQYFTNKELAEELYLKARKIINKYEKKISDYFWFEPSFGEGCFSIYCLKTKRLVLTLARWGMML